MPFAIPLVGKILAGLASSETSAPATTTQKTDADNASGGSNGVAFSQTVDDVSRAAASAASQNVHLGRT